MDKGAGLNLVHFKLLSLGWEDFVQSSKTLRTTDASRTPIDIKGKVPLYIQLGQFKVRAWFLVCPNLSVKAILGTSFIDQDIKAIYPGLWKVAFYHAPSISITGSTPGPGANHNRAVVSENTKSNRIRLSKTITIPPLTQLAVSVHSQFSGLVTIQNHPKTDLKHFTLMASGVMDIRFIRPFLVTISNFRDKPVLLLQGKVIDITLNAFVAIMEAQIYNFATPTPNEHVESWEGTVAIGAECESYRPQVLDLLKEYQAMWSGRLGKIRANAHRIDLQDDAKPQFQHPYCTGLKGREIVADQADKMRKAQVIEPVPPKQSEWTSPLVLV
ncbi:unnamed protein product [Agarophyton chilense]